MFVISPYKDWLIQLSEKLPDKELISFNGIDLKSGELLKKRNSVCEILHKSQISPKDTVAIISDNTLEFVVELLAIWTVGAVPVPINIRQSENEIIEQLDFVNAKLVFTESKLNLFNNKKLKFNIVSNDEAFNNSEAAVSEKWQIEPESLALLMFTSGASGTPKCVEITFRNLISSAGAVLKFLNVSPTETWLATLPFYHIGGFSIIIRALLGGNKLIIPQSNFFENISKYILSGKGNYLSLVPTMLRKLLNSKIIPHKDIKTVFLGGGRVTLEIVNRAIKSGYKIVTVYGSTETSSMIAADKLDVKIIKSSFAGKPLGNCEFQIINESGQKLSPEQIGEIAISSESVANGYLNNELEKSRRFKRDSKTKKKFYLTNDLGKIDSEGSLYVLGRKDDIIISGGENISTIEVADKIKEINFVEDSFAFGIEDENWGEKLTAVAVLKNGKDKTAQELKSQLEKYLPSYKIPKEIFIVSEIPRSALGKVIKDKILLLIKKEK